jgi:hypothetical protein
MTSVLLIIFNRPATTQRVFEAIRYARPSKLYIAADAPRPGNANDEEKCRLAKAVTEQIDWSCEVKRLYHEQNLGCSLGPRAAFDWFFLQETEGIILEDDCVPNPDFFLFAASMLERYRHNNQIISINGSNLGYELKNGDSYTYSRFMNMWGWATWRRSYKQIDYNLIHWQNIKYKELFLWKRLRTHLFDIDIAWIKYWRFQFDKTISTQKVTWWDYQWIYHQLINQQLAVVPGRNLISNIGFDENGHHTFFSVSPAANLPVKPLQIPFVHPKDISIQKGYEKIYIKTVWCNYVRFSRIQMFTYILKSILKGLVFFVK